MAIRPDIAADADAALTSEATKPRETSWWLSCSREIGGFRVTIGNASGFEFTFPRVVPHDTDADDICDLHLDDFIFEVDRRRDGR